ncbi:ABC transporter substrate-binding protein [Halopiger goleimassiliensis]|uniref:ABC transporter substrate-binding protein n=1 Tax=Halopiger goleimassiliensis TaxID=1293048 RepID=UPI0006778189|nr:ABC transporter substrate-binding protein [Halopiger goleimassiliensis]
MTGIASSDRAGADGVSRRRLLAATGLTTATAGCVRQLRSAVNRDDVDQLSLSITTYTADGDRESIQLARAIGEALEAVGIDVTIDMRSQDEVLRAVLVNHDFDVYVGPHPGGVDPDFLYGALHSRFAEEAGWQNPYGYTNLVVDDLLEAQRQAAGDERADAVAEMLEAFATELPFLPICVREEHRLVRTDRFDGWGQANTGTRLGYLGLEASGDDLTLEAAHTDPRVSMNLNPLSVEYRNEGTFTDLLYDSLATVDGDEVRPWLAADWEFDDGTLTVDLREDCWFHDGEAVTADDVAFTYRFLRDTTRGERRFPAPAPRFRGRVSLVESVDPADEHRVELSVDAGADAAARALLVPVLPAHIWEHRSSPPSVPGVDVAEGTTEALTTDNVPPVGSGPYEFADRSEREHVTLERVDDHFTRRDPDLPSPTAGRIRIQIDPRSTSAIELVESGDSDLTSLPLESYVVDDVIEGTVTAVDVLTSSSRGFYHVGFNTRKTPYSNPNFRRVVARLIDEAWLVEDVFHGHARATAMPVAEEWTPADLTWDDGNPVAPFLGTDGELDADAARSAFESIGFRYADDGTLRVVR